MHLGVDSFVSAVTDHSTERLIGPEERMEHLLEEKLDLLLRIRKSEHVTWSGRHRPPLTGQGVYPRPLQDPLPIWVGVGGTPKSFARAGALGLPLMVAIIGGDTRRFKP